MSNPLDSVKGTITSGFVITFLLWLLVELVIF